MTIIIYMENENDGKIVLTILNNKMEVRGDFFPGENNGKAITEEYIRELLEKSKIVHGIQHDEIHKALKACFNGETVKNVLIAIAEAPFDEVPEYMQFNPALVRKKEPVCDKSAVDHRARSPFTIIKKDQVLAKIKSRKTGRNGVNVHGETIPYKILKPEEVFAGENTRMEGKFLHSCINGQLVISKKTINVYPTLVIKNSVDYATGNIIFPGDVEIHGSVSDGFKIYSGGSITIKQTFDVTDAVAKKDLNVAGGIIGRGQAIVKVGGNLKTKFIENCRLTCRKTINVETEILNSRVFTLDKLEMGEKGQIVGGEIYAFKGLKTGGIGKIGAKAARIHCGIDFTLEQEKEKCNSILRMLAVKVNRLKELINDPQAGGEKKAKVEALLDKLAEEQKKAQNRVSELLGIKNTYEGAEIEVSGEITAGTLIEICQVALFVTKPLKKVRIRLDCSKSKLVVEQAQ